MNRSEENLITEFPDAAALSLPPLWVPEKYHKESVWHRNWKKAFPLEYREKSFCCQTTGELHRADVYTPCGTAIEFQNSPISVAEMKSREAFYPKMIWILNGKKFKGFKILKNLPHPDDPKLKDYEFRKSDHLSMVRKADVLRAVEVPKVLNFYHPEIKGVSITSNFYHFCWKQPHAVWFSATAPIIVDLGGHFLYRMRVRKQLSGDYPFLEMINRKTFIERYVCFG
ncbi:competence protein [Pedobacter sp. Leaf194]|uniref:competence protein CoiA family protein n=1 Tax=Pedobacter sp. Leaf194 TaxID=1736297 RepID=UPI000B074FB2|nr:competence protein [Pedobacter sp. Leaf194]